MKYLFNNSCQENFWVRTTIMNSDIYNVEEIKLILKPVFEKNGINKAILFGSYARGIAKPNSDIDILVDSGLQGLDFFGLVEHVHMALKKTVDIIDITSLKKNSPIEKTIEKTGIVIYGK